MLRNAEIDFKELKMVAVWNCMGEVAGLWPRGTLDLTESLSCQGLKGTVSSVRTPIIKY